MQVLSAGLAKRTGSHVAAGWQQGRQRIGDFRREPRATYQRHLAELPFDYPPMVIVISELVLAAAGITATIQRASYFPTALPILALVLLSFAFPIVTIFGIEPRVLPLCGFGLAAQALFQLQPVPMDTSPILLTVIAGEVVAIGTPRIGIPFTLVAMAELITFHLLGPGMNWLPFYLIFVALGACVGALMRYQRRFLHQEREQQTIRAAQAADEERRHIARDVHDVIAHSLSITLLHLTAARHALQTDHDVDDAIAALTDAERLGRQAMADIRRTIKVLDTHPSNPAATPGLADFDDLIGEFARSGLAIDYLRTGETEPVSATIGLALYRIGQESLANVIKHAPNAIVHVRLMVDATTTNLIVHNTMPSGLSVHLAPGFGLPGMRQRAELIGGRILAGPSDGGWSVYVQFPLTPNRSAPFAHLSQGSWLR